MEVSGHAALIQVCFLQAGHQRASIHARGAAHYPLERIGINLMDNPAAPPVFSQDCGTGFEILRLPERGSGIASGWC